MATTSPEGPQEPSRTPAANRDHLRVVWRGAPTKEEAAAANAGEYAPRGAERWLYDFTHSWATRLGLATAAVVGGVAVYQNIPAIQEFVDNSYQSLREKFSPETKVPTTFNNAAKEGIIGEANTEALTLEEIRELFPEQMVEQDNFLKFLFPFILPEGSEVKYERSSTPGGVFFDPKTGAEIRQERDWNKTIIRDNVTFNLPEGTIVINPATTHVGLGSIEGNIKSGDDPNKSSGAAIVFYNERLDATYQLLLFPTGNIGVRTPFEPLQPMQEKINKSDTGTEWKALPVIQQGEPLLRVPTDLTVKLRIAAWHGQDVRIWGQGNYFALAPDFITNQGKIVALEN